MSAQHLSRLIDAGGDARLSHYLKGYDFAVHQYSFVADLDHITGNTDDPFDICHVRLLRESKYHDVPTLYVANGHDDIA